MKKFIDAYNHKFKMKSVGFKADDVEMRENTEKVVAAMHDVAKVRDFSNHIANTHFRRFILKAA